MSTVTTNPKQPWTDEEMDIVHEMKGDGKSIHSIAKVVGRTTQEVYRLVRKVSVKRNRLGFIIKSKSTTKSTPAPVPEHRLIAYNPSKPYALVGKLIHMERCPSRPDFATVLAYDPVTHRHQIRWQSDAVPDTYNMSIARFNVIPVVHSFAPPPLVVVGGPVEGQQNPATNNYELMQAFLEGATRLIITTSLDSARRRGPGVVAVHANHAACIGSAFTDRRDAQRLREMIHEVEFYKVPMTKLPDWMGHVGDIMLTVRKCGEVKDTVDEEWFGLAEDARV